MIEYQAAITKNGYSEEQVSSQDYHDILAFIRDLLVRYNFSESQSDEIISEINKNVYTLLGEALTQYEYCYKSFMGDFHFRIREIQPEIIEEEEDSKGPYIYILYTHQESGIEHLITTLDRHKLIGEYQKLQKQYPYQFTDRSLCNLRHAIEFLDSQENSDESLETECRLGFGYGDPILLVETLR